MIFFRIRFKTLRPELEFLPVSLMKVTWRIIIGHYLRFDYLEIFVHKYPCFSRLKTFSGLDLRDTPSKTAFLLSSRIMWRSLTIVCI